jgi:hypothetical protein
MRRRKQQAQRGKSMVGTKQKTTKKKTKKTKKTKKIASRIGWIAMA